MGICCSRAIPDSALALPRRFERYIAPGADVDAQDSVDVLGGTGNVIEGKLEKKVKKAKKGKDGSGKQAAVSAKYAAYLARQAEKEAEGGCLGGF